MNSWTLALLIYFKSRLYIKDTVTTICPCNRSFGSGRALSHPPEKGSSAVLAGWKGRALPLCLLPQNTLFQSRFPLKSSCSWARRQNRSGWRTGPRLIEVHPQPHPECLLWLPWEVAVLTAAVQLLHPLLLGHAGDLQGVQPRHSPAPQHVQEAGSIPPADLEDSALVAAGEDVAHVAPAGRQQLQDVLPAAQPGHVHSHPQGTLRVKASPARLLQLEEERELAVSAPTPCNTTYKS